MKVADNTAHMDLVAARSVIAELLLKLNIPHPARSHMACIASSGSLGVKSRHQNPAHQAGVKNDRQRAKCLPSLPLPIGNASERTNQRAKSRWHTHHCVLS